MVRDKETERWRERSRRCWERGICWFFFVRGWNGYSVPFRSLIPYARELET